MAENGYIGRQPNDSSTVIARQQYQPVANQTEFVFTAGYDTGYVDVYMNGVRLAEGRDYNAGDGKNVYLVEAARSNDLLEVIAYKAFNPTAVQNFSDIQNGAIGIQSAGTLIGITTTINFVGAANTIVQNGDVIDISIEGGGGALGERVSDDPNSAGYKIYKQKKLLNMEDSVTLDPAEIGADYDYVAYVAEADVRVAVGETFQIGVGITFRSNILGIFPQ